MPLTTKLMISTGIVELVMFAVVAAMVAVGTPSAVITAFGAPICTAVYMLRYLSISRLMGVSEGHKIPVLRIIGTVFIAWALVSLFDWSLRAALL